MTQLQTKTIERIKNQFINTWCFTNEYEVKREETTEDILFDGTPFVTYYIEVGMKGDEHTLASVFGRTSMHVSIGVRGGLKDLRTQKNITSIHQAQTQF